MASREHGSVRGAYVQPAADESIIRLSSSGMSRSGDLDQLQSRMGRIDSGTDPTMAESATSYRGPFGHQGTDPDADFASVTTKHVPLDS